MPLLQATLPWAEESRTVNSSSAAAFVASFISMEARNILGMPKVSGAGGRLLCREMRVATRRLALVALERTLAALDQV